MTQSNQSYRVERDPIGEVNVPADALYGVQTTRALENFQISNLRIHPALIIAYAEVKKAAAWANIQTGKLEQEIGDVIIRSADEIIGGCWREHFSLDVFQAGAGTSYNMNMNEVIANRSLELLGDQRGNYERIEPNDHVNKSQSTNDTMPTAMRIAVVRLLRELVQVIEHLVASFTQKGEEFADIQKAGRTHLHDATPMTLGQEFNAYAGNLRRAMARLAAMEEALLEIPLGGTALGTGENADPDYAPLAIDRLAEITGLKVRAAADRIQSQQSLGDFVAVSAALRGFAVELSKIANDLRLLNSGPHTGLYEIELPALQPGSSIMPGKVNPATAEMINMVCFHTIGRDVAIMMCAEAGQLEVNVMMPYVAYALLETLAVMTQAVDTFDEKGVQRIRAHPDRCQRYAERSVGNAAKLNEELGFMGAAEVAMQAIETGETVKQVMEKREAAH